LEALVFPLVVNETHEELPKAWDQAALGSMASVGLPEELVWPASAAVPKLAITTLSA
jgi:hypothetical protein